MTVVDRHEGAVHDHKTIRYPQDVDVELGFYSPGDTNLGYAAIAKPQDFEDLGIGTSLSAVTLIHDDLKTIAIDINVRLTEEPEIIQTELSSVSSAGNNNLFFEKTNIKEYVADIYSEVQDGEAILLGGGMNSKNDELVYIFLTCEIMSEPERQSD